jgi:BlaI family transcriptional regulator, penicillinase repressor
MSGGFQDVSDAELSVLHILWDRGPSAVREIVGVLYPEGNPSHYATVQKLLERLEVKQCVVRNRAVRPHQFAASIVREDLVGHRLRTIAEKVCGGSLAPLLTHFVRGGKLSSAERTQLRAMLDELEDSGKRSKHRKK